MIASFTPVDIGVIRMPLCSDDDRVLDRVDLAVIVTLRLAGCDGDVDAGASPAFLAPACMATKNGFVESFVINETAIFWDNVSPADVPLGDVPLGEDTLGEELLDDELLADRLWRAMQWPQTR